MIWSTTVRTSSESSPSAMTRISGSVPDLRTRMRPRLAQPRLGGGDRLLHGRRRQALRWHRRTRTFFRSCGTGSKARKVSLAGLAGS